MPSRRSARGRGLLYAMNAPGDPIDNLAMATSMVPGVGDAIGLLSDARAIRKDPSLANIGMGLLSAMPFVPPIASIKRGQKVFRADPKAPKNPGEGAIFFSHDRDYVNNYMSDDRRLIEASVPDDVIDIRVDADRAQIADWVRKKLKALEGSDDWKAAREAREALSYLDKGDVDSVNRAMAQYGLAAGLSEFGQIIPGLAEKRLLDELGRTAMTVKEAGTDAADNFSIAFRSMPGE